MYVWFNTSKYMYYFFNKNWIWCVFEKYKLIYLYMHDKQMYNIYISKWTSFPPSVITIRCNIL